MPQDPPSNPNLPNTTSLEDTESTLRIKQQSALLDHRYPLSPDQLLFSQTLIKLLEGLADETVRQGGMRFFKSEIGDYAYGDMMLGIRTPELRLRLRPYLLQAQASELPVIHYLLSNRWHEVRYCSLVMLTKMVKRTLKSLNKSAALAAQSDQTGNTSNPAPAVKSVLVERAKSDVLTFKQELKTLCEFYVEHAFAVNNWDLVDISAPYLIGIYLSTLDFEQKMELLLPLAHSSDLWKNRMALVSNLTLVKKGDIAPALALIPLYLDTTNDLLQKAFGWMLREVGKHDIACLKQLLEQYGDVLPRISLRYAIEHMSKEERRYYMSLKKLSAAQP